jgi:hypothetical protein
LSTDTKTFKLIKQVKDASIDIDHLEKYLLCIQIGMRDVQIMVADSRTNQCLLLEDYIIEEYDSIAEKKAFLQQIFEQHHLLMARFWKNILLSFKSDKFCLVPLAYFSKESARDYLQLNAQIDSENEGVGYYKINKLDAANIFCFEKEILSWIRELYGKDRVRVTHQSGMLINSFMSLGKALHQPQLSIYIDRFILHLAVHHKNELTFYNQFHIKSFEDYTKYIGLVTKEFGLNLPSSKISLYGFIKEKSAHFNKLKDQFPQIEIGQRPSYLKYGFVFDEVADHQYTDVYGIYLNN